MEAIGKQMRSYKSERRGIIKKKRTAQMGAELRDLSGKQSLRFRQGLCTMNLVTKIIYFIYICGVFEEACHSRLAVLHLHVHVTWQNT